MTLRKAVFEVTADSQAQPLGNPTLMSHGYDDVRLRPSIGTRHAKLVSVTIDVSAAKGKDVEVTLSELEDATDTLLDTSDDTTETYALGRQLFNVPLELASVLAIANISNDVYEFDVRRAVLTDLGAAPTTTAVVGDVIIREDWVRCEVYKMAPADVVTVTMYYETVGDYRF